MQLTEHEKYLNAYYIKDQDVMNWKMTTICSWVWRKIMKCWENIVGTTYWADLDQAGKYKTSTMYLILRREKEQVNLKQKGGKRPILKIAFADTIYEV